MSQLRVNPTSTKQSGAVKELIEKIQKTFDEFKKEMLRMAMSIQGLVGYTWHEMDDKENSQPILQNRYIDAN